MTCLIREEAQSVLDKGIETVLIPIRHPLDLQDLVFHAKRGGTYDVVEWLLSQLYRESELERVCGLSINPHKDGTVHINLEMRQPGKELERFVTELVPGMGLMLLRTNSGKELVCNDRVVLCERSWSGQFTDKYKPWWPDQVSEIGKPDHDG